MNTFRIVRFHEGDAPGESKVIETGLTLEEAQAHCNRPDTRGIDESGLWFDGYTREEA